LGLWWTPKMRGEARSKMTVRVWTRVVFVLPAMFLSPASALANDKDTPVSWSKDGQNEPGSDKPARLYWFEASRDPEGKIAFTPREIDDQSGIGTQFVVADLNGDGLLDIVTANKKGVFLFEQVRPAK